MSNCSNHKKEAAGISDMKELAEMIGDLHYKTLGELFEYLARKIEWDAKNDYMGNRVSLAGKLSTASHLIRSASIFIDDAYQISKPYMTSETGKEKGEQK